MYIKHYIKRYFDKLLERMSYRKLAEGYVALAKLACYLMLAPATSVNEKNVNTKTSINKKSLL